MCSAFLWLLFWLPIYKRPEEHPKVSRAELDHIQSDPPDPPAAKIPWVRLIPHRQTSAFAIGKYLTDPIWWFYLYWIPNFFRDQYQSEAAFQTARDVIFAAAFPNLKTASRVNTPLAGIESQHYLAERHDVPAAVRFVLDT